MVEWDAELAAERATLGTHAARLARPGPVPPLRASQHLAALQAGQLRWAVQRLPGDLAGGLRPAREPAAWLKQSIAYVVREQLSLLGAAAAEVARIIDQSEGLAPAVVVEELRRRPVRATPLPTRTVERIVRAALDGTVRHIVAGPLSVTRCPSCTGPSSPTGPGRSSAPAGRGFAPPSAGSTRQPGGRCWTTWPRCSAGTSTAR